VPALPARVDRGSTYYIYYNIDWQSAGPAGSDAKVTDIRCMARCIDATQAGLESCDRPRGVSPPS
jgi:hypothetical protein